MNPRRAIGRYIETRSRRFWVTAGCVAVLALAVGWSFVEPRLVGVSRAIVSSPDVPAEFDGVTIAYLSDIHAGPYLGGAAADALVDKTMELRPDLIILGGDNVGGRANGVDIIYPRLRRLRAPLGVLAVMGNHDVWEGQRTARSRLESAGILLLENDAGRVRNGGGWIRVAGVEDLMTQRPSVSEAMTDIGTGEFAVIVSHHPDVFATQLAKHASAVDLALAGHTHAGQLTAFGLWAPFVPSAYGQRYRAGWLAENGVPILVSRGIGCVTLPVRFFAPPEIVFIQLRKGPKGVVHE
jgi:predicted MPP superfamily phosphohydrolase